MPQRTNEYQRLVKLIHQALAGRTAKVSESVLVKASGIGDVREIDVLVESEIPTYRMKVAIEAKDQKRKLSQTDMDAFIGKYCEGGKLIVDKVVIVCRNGYSKPARRRAKVVGIELVTLTEFNLDELMPFGKPQTFQGMVGPIVERVTVEPPVLGNAILDSKLVCNCHGDDFGSLYSYANFVMTHYCLTNPEVQKKMQEEMSKPGGFCLKVRWPMKQKFVMVYNLTNLERMQIVLPEYLNFHVHAQTMTGPVEFKSYKMSGDTVESRTIDHAVVVLGNHKLELLFPNGLQSEGGYFEFSRCVPCTAQGPEIVLKEQEVHVRNEPPPPPSGAGATADAP